MFADKSWRENQNAHFMFNYSAPENGAAYVVMWKNLVEPNRPQMIIQHGTCAMHARYLRLQTSVQNMQYLLLSHGKNCCTNSPQYYVMRTLVTTKIHWP